MKFTRHFNLQPSRVLFHYLHYISVLFATFQTALWEHSGQDSNPVQCTLYSTSDLAGCRALEPATLQCPLLGVLNPNKRGMPAATK